MQYLRTAGGARAGGLKHVLDRHRDAVQRTAMLSADNFVIRLLGFGARLLAEDGDEGVELAFDSIETRQSRAYGLAR